jgi:hypothetical protein
VDERQRKIRQVLRALEASARMEGRFKHVIAMEDQDDAAFFLASEQARPMLASSRRMVRAHRDELLELLGYGGEEIAKAD